MPNWGPVTVSNGPGSATPDSRSVLVQHFGPFLPGAVNRISGTEHVTFTGGRSDATYAIVWIAYAADGDIIESTEVVSLRLTTADSSWNRNVPLGATDIDIRFLSALYAGQTQTAIVSGTYDAGSFCAFGTRSKASSTGTLVLTADNIAEVLATRGYSWLGIAFQALVGLVIDVPSLCGVGPPQVPELNVGLLSASNEEKLQILKRVLWDEFCECVPGAPTPDPYPLYAPTEPTSWPAAPVFPCDPADLCAALEAIRADLNSLMGTAAATKTLVELVQRYELPFAYIRGAQHSALTAQGSFAVSRLVGIDLDITARPATGLTLRGNPPYHWDLGWVSISDTNGMIEEKRVTRDSMLWLPRLMATAIAFSWDLFDGVVLNATELQAEP